GTMVTVDPFGSMASTFPPGFSRTNAPPPSEALMSPMMGVGSEVTVEVSVSLNVGRRVGVDVRVTVCVGTPTPALAPGASVSAVDSVNTGEDVMLGGRDGEIIAWVTGAGSGVARPAR